MWAGQRCPVAYASKRARRRPQFAEPLHAPAKHETVTAKLAADDLRVRGKVRADGSCGVEPAQQRPGVARARQVLVEAD